MPLSVIPVCVPSFVDKIRCLSPPSPTLSSVIPDFFFCHPRPRSGIQRLSLSLSSLYVFTNSLTRFVVSFCHPRSSIKNVKDKPRSGIQGLGGSLFGKTRDDTSPTGSWCLCVGAGLGARPSFLFSCGVSPPHDEGRRIVGCRPHTTRSFCFGKRTQNQWRPGGAPQRGSLCPGPWCVGCGTRCAQTVLAAKMEGTGPGHSPARRRQEAAFVSSVMPGSIGHPAFCHPRPSCCHPRPSCCHPRPPPSVIPDPRLKMSRTSPDRGSSVFPSFCHSGRSEESRRRSRAISSRFLTCRRK